MGSRSFNGTTDVAIVGNVSALNITGAVSIVCWANPASFPASGFNWGVMATKGSGPSTETYTIRFSGAGLASGTGNYLQATTYNGTASAGAEFIHSISTGTWNHIAGVCNSSGNWFLYLNGTSVGTQVNNPQTPFSNTSRFTIGAWDGNGTIGRWFNGKVADVAVWNVALTQLEITALSRGARPWMIREPALQGWWPLDAIASPEPDLSGNANNATLTGTAAAFGAPTALFTPRWPQYPFLPPPPTFTLMPQIVT